MKNKLIGLLILAFAAVLVIGCDDDAKALQIQKLTTYDDQYYANLRDFKKSDHEVSYAYYEAWSPIQGVSGYKDPASWGERMIGLPDSIDIVNLWMGVPTSNNNDANNKLFGLTYAPVAAADIQYCQKVKGTRFVTHADASNMNHTFTVDGVYYDISTLATTVTIQAYGKWLVEQAQQAGLDGIDLDYEGWTSANLTTLVTYMGSLIGPKGADPSKLLIVDYFSSTPPSAIAPYCNYVVQQAYSNQTSASFTSSWPTEKVIFCETFGLYWSTGGQLYNYARKEPTTGRKGGCGVFYLGRNYQSASGIPYYEFRQAIQIMNPAIH